MKYISSSEETKISTNEMGDWKDTVDGRNPAPVEVGSLSHDLQGFILYIPGGAGFLPSTV